MDASERAVTVVLVEDDADLRVAYELCFHRLGFDVLSFSGGHEAYANISRWGPACPADLLVTDLHMDEGDGAWLTRQVRERFPDLPILLLTGSFARLKSSPDFVRSFSAVLEKPFQLKDLTAECRKLIEGVPLKA